MNESATTSQGRRRVVVTGYGIVSPLGVSADETFSQAAAGRSGIRRLAAFDPTGLPCTIAGMVPAENLPEMPPGVHPRTARLMSRAVRWMFHAATEACNQAGVGDGGTSRRTAVVLGAHGENPPLDAILFFHRLRTGPSTWDIPRALRTPGFDSLQICRRKPDLGAALLADRFGFGGPNLTIVSACAAGAQAIGEAVRLIREGRCEAALAGGCEAALTITGFTGFVLLKAMAEKYDEPEKASRPFDRKRSGFVMSEGAGAVYLEEREQALARGVPILGEVLGYGDSADAYRITDVHPAGEGAILAMRGALADAGLSPEAVDYVNAHGTSTLLNDATETKAVKTVLGERAREVPCSSNKSFLGHTIAAAGAIECVLSLKGMRASLLLPTLNYEHPDPKCDLDYVPNVARPAEHRVVLSNSFGFGGQNACLCLGRGDGAA